MKPALVVLGISSFGPYRHCAPHSHRSRPDRENLERRLAMKGLLLWLIGIPLPVVLLLYLFDFL